MKISLRFCPVCDKPTLQAKRKDGIGKTMWYCPNCGRGNRDCFLSAKRRIKAEPEFFKLATDWGKERVMRDRERA